MILSENRFPLFGIMLYRTLTGYAGGTGVGRGLSDVPHALRAGRARLSIGPPAFVRQWRLRLDYCAACVFSAAISASLRTVITPIWLDR